MGRAIAQALAKDGIPVIINYQSNSQAAEETRQSILERGGKAELMPFDVKNEEAVATAIDQWEENHPEDYIAYLVNNAGIRRDNVMFMMPTQDWHAVIDTSLNGFYYVTKRLLPKMMARKHGGRIVPTTAPPRPRS